MSSKTNGKRSGAAQRAKTTKAARKRPASAQASAQRDGETLGDDLQRESVLPMTAIKAEIVARQFERDLRQVFINGLDDLDLSETQVAALSDRLKSATDDRLAALKQSIAEQVADNDRERDASRDLIAQKREAGHPASARATDDKQASKLKPRGKPFAAGFDERRNLEGRPKQRTLSEAMREKLAQIVPGAANIDEQTYAESLIEVVILEALQKRDLRAVELARKLTEPDRVVFDWRGKARMMGYDPDRIASVVSNAVNAAMADPSSDTGRANTQSDDEDEEQDEDD